MEKGKKDRSVYFVGLVFFAVLCLHFFLALAWQKRFFINFFGSSDCFTDAMSWAYQGIARFGQDFSLFYKFNRIAVGSYWPPAVTIIGAVNLLVLPVQWFFLPNFFYLAVVMLGIYFSTRFLIGDKFYSMLAAVIFSCYWVVMVQLVAFEVQLAAVACIVWGFYSYLRSYFFTRFGPSLLVGLWMVLAVYCDRVTPGLFVFALFLVPQNFRKKRSWLFMGLALVFVWVCAWPYYKAWFGNKLVSAEMMASLFSQGNDYSLPAEVYRTVLCTPQFLGAHCSYYFISLTEKLIGYSFTALCVLGLFSLHRLKNPYAQVLWIALGVPFLIFLGILKKDHLYIFPLCIYFAMISGIGIAFVRRRGLRYLLILLIAGVTAAQYLSFFDPFQRKNGFLFSQHFEKLDAQGIPRLFLGDYPGTQGYTAKQVYSIVDQISPLINQRALRGEKKQAVVVDLQDYFPHHAAVFLLRTRLQRAKVLNAFYAWSRGPDEDCHEDFLYLLSDKEQYAVQKGPGSGGGCSWKGLEPLYRIPGSATTLYTVQR